MSSSKKPGKCTLFTPDTQDEIVKLLRQTRFRKDVCRLIGISTRTLQEWIRRAKKRQHEIDDWYRRKLVADEAGRPFMVEQPSNNEFTEFLIRVNKAEAEAKAEAEKIVEAQRGDKPEVAQWWLERKYPLEWGPAAMRPGIGINARAEDVDPSDERDPETELMDAVNAFEDSVRAATDNTVPRKK